MTSDLFAKWLVEFNCHMAWKNRKVLLILSNCLAHYDHLHLIMVAMLFLPPNSTSKMQPLVMGITHAFKVCYRRCVTQHMLIAIDRPAINVALQISPFMAVEMLKAAWVELTLS